MSALDEFSCKARHAVIKAGEANACSRDDEAGKHFFEKFFLGVRRGTQVLVQNDHGHRDHAQKGK